MTRTALFTAMLMFAQTGHAIHPDAITSWCNDRALADKYPADAGDNYHTEYHTDAILGYLTAVLDSLYEDNPACQYQISGQEFCSAFKSHMSAQKKVGKSSFRYSRETISSHFDCKPGSDAGK